MNLFSEQRENHGFSHGFSQEILTFLTLALLRDWIDAAQSVGDVNERHHFGLGT